MSVISLGFFSKLDRHFSDENSGKANLQFCNLFKAVILRIYPGWPRFLLGSTMWLEELRIPYLLLQAFHTLLPLSSPASTADSSWTADDLSLACSARDFPRAGTISASTPACWEAENTEDVTSSLGWSRRQMSLLAQVCLLLLHSFLTAILLVPMPSSILLRWFCKLLSWVLRLPGSPNWDSEQIKGKS